MGKFLRKLLSTFLFVILFLPIFYPYASHAQVSQLLTAPFGGRIFAIMYLPFFCPPHVVIDDVEGLIDGVPQKIGIVPLGKLYSYYNLYTLRVWTLGNRLRTPMPCPYPYPVYKMTITGTSEIP